MGVHVKIGIIQLNSYFLFEISNIILIIILTMPRKFIQFLQGGNIYTCEKCGSHLASLSNLISRAFVGKTGRAFLFTNVINIRVGKPQKTQLRTGIHVIADIYCAGCKEEEPIGWKYISTEQNDQKYKEGNYILEKAYLNKENWMDD